jgi:hypothetical protein
MIDAIKVGVKLISPNVISHRFGSNFYREVTESGIGYLHIGHPRRTIIDLRPLDQFALG